MYLNYPLAERILGRVEIQTIEKRMRGEKLSQVERNYLSRSIKPKLAAAQMLCEAKLLDKLGKPDRALEKKIVFSLDKHGYGMLAKKRVNTRAVFSLEELIAVILAKCPKARFVEAIPVLLLKNEVNEFKLVEAACRHNIMNKLGFLVEVAGWLAAKHKVKRDYARLLAYLNGNKENRVSFLGEEKDEEYKKFLEETSPQRLRKWNLLGRFFDADFERIAKVHCA